MEVKWRRLCTTLLCLLVEMFSVFVYHYKMEQWFTATIGIGSGILVVLFVVLHVALVELPEIKGNIATEPNYRGGSTMYYNILKLVPYCAIFTFLLMPHGDPWSLWCSMLLCIDLLLIGVCNSKASDQLNSVPNSRAKAMKWMRAVSFGLVLLPALILMHFEHMEQDSYKRNLARIWLGFLVILFVVIHIIFVEMDMVKEGDESVKRS